MDFPLDFPMDFPFVICWGFSYGIFPVGFSCANIGPYAAAQNPPLEFLQMWRFQWKAVGARAFRSPLRPHERKGLHSCTRMKQTKQEGCGGWWLTLESPVEWLLPLPREVVCCDTVCVCVCVCLQQLCNMGVRECLGDACACLACWLLDVDAR